MIKKKKTMSKAEDKALKAYPINIAERDGYDENLRERKGFVKGYHQAEKDLELGWRDIRIILDIENDILCECNSQKELVIETYPKGEDYYGEILKRFKEMKEK